jgi:hypothetical protein
MEKVGTFPRPEIYLTQGKAGMVELVSHAKRSVYLLGPALCTKKRRSFYFVWEFFKKELTKPQVF